jgi:hypothetical protein
MAIRVLVLLVTVVAACSPAPPATPPTPPPVSPPATTVSATVPVATVPNVVGMNHQAAQDLLQAAGFYILLEQDADGQGRPLVLDRNWEVVSQSVPAGTSAPLDTPITLTSKKIA